ncbi:MAG: hypothetical protein JWR90_847 [Marmoricola sp.]|jgi:hypothetical protein|nr:hypothetical protein [Marmoricola sp.]
MSIRRSVASVAGLVALALTASTLGSGVASAAPAPSRVAAVTAPAAKTAAVKAARYPGQPPRNYVFPNGNYFTFPNAAKGDRLAIRNRILMTIQGVWGGPRDANGLPLATNGTIRIATWSFEDMGIAKALVAAHKRGVSVQVMAAKKRNKGGRPWKLLVKNLGSNYYKNGVAGSSDKVSFARACRGACRGHGGTPHSKYMLFDNVGYAHVRHVVVSTSANLTSFAVSGQWNEAQTFTSDTMWSQFMTVFRETRLGIPQSQPYRRYVTGNTASMFFPRPSTSPAGDPVMQALNPTRCLGSTTGGSTRTKIRIIQYAIYDPRGVWLSKKLRALWNAGCDVAIIYTLATRPVLQILRNGSGRGPIPMKQSVITNSHREIVKYNHSKWVTIAGNWGPSTASFVTFAGSANWSNAAFNNDEQMQQTSGLAAARAHLINFNRTWAQGSSHSPGYGVKPKEARYIPQGNSIPWGKGAFKYLNPNG